MHLKEKRQKAFLEYIQLISQLEESLYSFKDTVLQAPSIKGDPNDFQLTSIELIFASIYSIQEKYKRNYSILKEFLEKAIFLNDTYQLNFTHEIDDITIKITDIEQKLLVIQKVREISPPIEPTEANFRSSVAIYDNYIEEVSELSLPLLNLIDVSMFDYRAYLKDDFYKYVKKLKVLMNLTAGSGYNLVSMRNCSVINALDDESWNEDIQKHYPQK